MHDTNLLEDQPIAWTPTPEVIERAQLTRFMRQVGVTTWAELYEFSIRDVEKFTEEVLKFLDIQFDPPYERLLDTSDGIEFPRWFGSNAERGTRNAESDIETRRHEAETRPVGRVSSSNAERGVRNAESDAETWQQKSELGAVATGSPGNAECGMRNAESDANDDHSRFTTHHSPLTAGLNITTMCLDRWQTDEMKDQPAVIWEGEDGNIEVLSYSQLKAKVDSCAAGLRFAGIRKGDAIGIHLPMLPATVIALLAINRIGSIAVPVFSGYGVDAIASRLNAVAAKGLITCTGFARRGKHFDAYSVAKSAAKSVKSLRRIVVVADDESEWPGIKVKSVSWSWLLDSGKNLGWRLNFPAPTSAEDPLIVLYTSGTTGKPKGVAHTHASFPIKAAQDMAFGTDVGRGTRICWYTDIGWMMGPWLIYGALINGATICIYDGAPDYPTPDRMWEFCAKHKVEVLGISPTLVRALAAHEESATGAQASGLHQGEARKSDSIVEPRSFDAAEATAWQAGMPALQSVGDVAIKPPHQRHDLSALRAFASTGEPWNPAPWWWLFEKVGNSKLPIINYSGGTEIAGGILMGNPLLPIKPCSFPAPCPGMNVDILDEDGNSVEPGKVGELVIKQPWIGMARGFWQEKERYLDTYWRRFPNIWVHGDWAMRDKDGHWFILGRSDDTLKVAGKRVGPAEVESLLVAHPLVTEAAVIGVPDEKKGTAMVAFCVVKEEGGRMKDEAGSTGHSSFIRHPSSLQSELRELVARDMGKPLAPSKIHFVSALPKTRNAKVMRRVIRSAYLGEDPGDLSALENPNAVGEIKALR